MLRYILVPLDGSALSEQALQYATEVIAPDGHIILLSVVEMPSTFEYTLVDVPMTAVLAQDITEAEINTTYRRVSDYLENKARSLRAKGYKVDCETDSGDPATVINDVANAKAVDAIVMTTHGRTGLNRWLFGSVTQKVVSNMSRPVMVIPGTIPEKAEESARTGQFVEANT